MRVETQQEAAARGLASAVSALREYFHAAEVDDVLAGILEDVYRFSAYAFEALGGDSRPVLMVDFDNIGKRRGRTVVRVLYKYRVGDEYKDSGIEIVKYADNDWRVFKIDEERERVSYKGAYSNLPTARAVAYMMLPKAPVW